MANLQKYIEYSREVQQARENNQPIVALESTIIRMVCRTHKMLKWQQQ